MKNYSFKTVFPEWYRFGSVITFWLAFTSGWAYAIYGYGFFLGVGLGWIPSFFLAMFAAWVWPLTVLVASLIGVGYLVT